MPAYPYISMSLGNMFINSMNYLKRYPVDQNNETITSYQLVRTVILNVTTGKGNFKAVCGDIYKCL